MSMTRRAAVKLAGVLGGVATAAFAHREGLAGEMQIDQGDVARPATAKGNVASYSEGFQPSFTLSEMPEGVKQFGIDQRVAPQLGRILLLAAEKAWEVHVDYTQFPKGGGSAYGVTVKFLNDPKKG